MCGIAGYVDRTRMNAPEALVATVTAMADAIRHRGPDDDGTWVDAAAGVALGFRRLAILDVTPAGHQPMISHDGRWVTIFNGEIYNHLDIRAELDGRESPRWRGHADTETLVEAVSAWGIDGALARVNGMMACAIWDRRDRRLHLVRDRVGKKPLYYGWAGETFLFGSELKALRAHPAFDAAIDREALASYLRYNYIPAPRSIYRGICKLLPGTRLELSCADGATRDPRIVSYWSASAAVGEAVRTPHPGSRAAILEELDTLLRDAVALRLLSDVPLGAFLSGGIDSSLVVALMQAQSPRPVKTFTIGFREREFSEAEYARRVAAHLGTQHTELYVSPEETMAVVPRLPLIFDEPFADSSQIPTFLVSQLARGSVTVALSGDGGDELFGGYTRYQRLQRNFDTIARIPRPVRRGFAAALRTGGMAGAMTGRLLPRQLARQVGAESSAVAAEVLAADGSDALYRFMVSAWKNPSAIALGAPEPPVAAELLAAPVVSPVERAMFADLVTYLPDDILAKVDRTSMAVSLEARCPLLDVRVVSLAWRIPFALKVQAGVAKGLLRELLARYVPPALFERPKMGFGIPLDEWLRGPLRDWAEALMHPQRLKSEGFLDAAPIRRKWDAHLSGRDDWGDTLWGVLMFQAWLEAQR